MKNIDKNTAFVLGVAILIIGIVMVLVWWPDVVSFFKGVLGMVLAVGGLVMMHGKKA